MFRELVSTTSRIAVSQALAGHGAEASPTGSRKLIAQTMRANEPLFMRSSFGDGANNQGRYDTGEPPGFRGIGCIGRASPEIDRARLPVHRGSGDLCDRKIGRLALRHQRRLLDDRLDDRLDDMPARN